MWNDAYASAVNTTWRFPPRELWPEMIEPEFVLQLLILLFDCLPLMRQPDERFQ